MKLSFLATVFLFWSSSQLVASFTLQRSPSSMSRFNTYIYVASNVPLTKDSENSSKLISSNPVSVTSSLDLAPEDYWVKNLDYGAFQKEVNDLGIKLRKEAGADDVKHLEKIVLWRNISMVLGVMTMWMPVNPLSVIALSTWTYSSWTMIAHHTCHGGYNRIMNDESKTLKRFNSRGFALGSLKRRVLDWCDWMKPEAWNLEHNRLHHYHLSESKDPDLVERNFNFLRTLKLPILLKYAIIGAMLPIWKWFYYAPNTFKELQVNKFKQENKPLPEGFNPEKAITALHFLFPTSSSARVAVKEGVIDFKSFVSKVVGPFLLTRFILLPAPLLIVPKLGVSMFGNAIRNLVLAELLTNIHAFVTIVTNHAGDDLYKFDDEVKPKTGSFYVRQVVSSANYNYGNDILDFAHGFLNYQVEHHVFPDLTMLQYQKAAPILKAICEKHGVPYIKHNVFYRVWKTFEIMVGRKSMRPFPTQFEPAGDKAVKGVRWNSTNGAIDEE